MRVRLRSAVGLALALSCAMTSASARSCGDLHIGDWIACTANGTFGVYDHDGVALESFIDGLGGYASDAFYFAPSNRLYALDQPNSIVVIFDGSNGHAILSKFSTTLHGGNQAESLVFDSSGHFYVGHHAGNRRVQEYTLDGTYVASFAVDVEKAGSDRIELARDQRTLFYTSEGRRVMRYDLATQTQLPDFALLPPSTQAQAVRLLPPFDGSGGAIVATFFDLKRLDASGAIVQTYDAPGQQAWFSVCLDPNGTSLWSCDFANDHVDRLNLATGALELGPITVAPGYFHLYGLTVVGELEGALAPPRFEPPTPTDQTLSCNTGCAAQFELVVDDLDLGDALTLEVRDAPPEVSFSPPLPFTGAPDRAVRVQANWTPRATDLGAHRMVFCARDSSGLASSASVTLDVVGFAEYCVAKTNSAGCTPTIGARGSASASGPEDLNLLATELLDEPNALLLVGLGADAQTFGGGTLCVASPLVRKFAPVAAGTGACGGSTSVELDHAWLRSRGFAAGTRLFAQFYARDPAFAPPDDVQWSDALRWVVCPR